MGAKQPFCDGFKFGAVKLDIFCYSYVKHHEQLQNAMVEFNVYKLIWSHKQYNFGLKGHLRKIVTKDSSKRQQHEITFNY